jgi:tetratricopeptide (TPR) repeat protein/uncharacterized caspase-like protein
MAALAVLLPGVAAQDQRERGLKVKVGATPDEVKSGRAADMNLWAVLIGISRYKYGDQNVDGYQISNLKNAGDDAQAIYEFLRSPEGGGFRDESEGGHMILLKDEQATRANVESALARLKMSRPNDYFVIYIAAHGAIIPQREPGSSATTEVPYFLLYDTDLRDTRNTALKMEAFRQVVSEIPAKKGLVLSDTCHSGGVQLAGRSDASSTSIRANNRYIDEMNRVATGVGFISAADQLEQSYENDYLQHGVFTHCLLEALSLMADVNNDGIVTFNELVAYLREEVPKLTSNKQHPHYNTTAIAANQLPLAVVNYTDLRTGGGQNSYGALKIRTPDIDGVEVAIDDKPMATLDSRTQRTLAVPAGMRKLSFTKGAMRRDLQATIEPGRSKLIEVNLTFSESDEDAIVASTDKQVTVFLRENKEPSKEARDLFTRGVDSFNRMKFEEAIESFNRAIQANGNAYSEAFVYRGRAEQSLGRKEAAVASFKAALALMPTAFETETLLAEAKFNAGYDVQEVIGDLRRIIRKHPDFDFARLVYADVLLSRRDKDYIGAERELRRALTSNPKNPAAHLILADVLTYQPLKEKQRRAVEEAQRALELFEEVSKKQVSASRGLRRLSISHIIFGGGRYINASAMAEAHHILGKALTRLVEYDESIVDPDTYLDRARTHINEAAKLAKALPYKHRLVLVLDTSAQNHLRKGNIAQAIADAQGALKTGESIPELKDYSEAHYTLYAAYKSDQRFAKAAEHLQKYLDAAGSQLTPDERNNLQEELNRIKRLKDANRQKD